MLPVRQRTDTDCFKCCVATLMNWPYEYVPDFMNDTLTDLRYLMPDQIARMDRWFDARTPRLTVLRFPIISNRFGEGSIWHQQPPGLKYILGGLTIKGVAHSWIVMDDHVIFDPASPSQPPYAGFYDSYFMAYFITQKW